MTPLLRGLLAAAAVSFALPAAAQPAPAAPTSPAAVSEPGARYMKRMKRGPRAMFTALSPEGRRTMIEAMRSTDRAEQRQQLRDARERMLAVLDAERLDTAALRRAMDDERRFADASREARQAALLAGYSKLSLADRRAYVAEARSLKGRVDERMKLYRERRLGEVPPPGAPLPGQPGGE